ncbi:MAG: hypothetical protein A2Y62_13580 [Candidatus Fischerbacteria bacterium RBG_13_37_8]|uniref:CBM6 domain-containing protein n=1 Tax=Candidatus Fischerbacteria bacterium RBG_13_37_8 TaxID=1817863 RepID=A0A1F5V769_9BACT|nr:MAG: hypothetical protein A2Y62_13580 [Candidatus Fischerbacteria bacterium RBG_13_37_8]
MFQKYPLLFILRITVVLFVLSSSFVDADSYQLISNDAVTVGIDSSSCTTNEISTLLSEAKNLSGGTYSIIATMYFQGSGIHSGWIRLKIDDEILGFRWLPSTITNGWQEITISNYISLAKASHTVKIEACSWGTQVVFGACLEGNCNPGLGRQVTIVRTSCP